MCGSLAWPVSRPSRGMRPPVSVACRWSKGWIGAASEARMGTTLARGLARRFVVGIALSLAVVEDREIQSELAAAFAGDSVWGPDGLGGELNLAARELRQA